jgi:hypothetical protein
VNKLWLVGLVLVFAVLSWSLYPKTHLDPSSPLEATIASGGGIIEETDKYLVVTMPCSWGHTELGSEERQKVEWAKEGLERERQCRLVVVYGQVREVKGIHYQLVYFYKVSP